MEKKLFGNNFKRETNGMTNLSAVEKLLKEALSEANTINNEVDNKATEIYGILLKKNLYDKDIQFKKYPNNVEKRIISFYNTFMNINCLWTFFAYVVDENTYYEKIETRASSEGSTYTDGKKIVFINIYFYTDGKIFDKAEVYDSIQHELNHVFKALKVGKTMENDSFIAYINTLMALPNTAENYYKKIIGDICYIGRKDEQDSFINGAYAFLKQKMPIDAEDIKETLYQTALVNKLKRLIELKESFPYLCKDEKFINEIKNIPVSFNITINKLKMWTDNGIKRLQNKIGTMLSAYNRYLYGKGYHSSKGMPPISSKDF